MAFASLVRRSGGSHSMWRCRVGFWMLSAELKRENEKLLILDDTAAHFSNRILAMQCFRLPPAASGAALDQTEQGPPKILGSPVPVQVDH